MFGFNGGFAILCGRQIAAPTVHVLVRGEIVSDGGELTATARGKRPFGAEQTLRAPTALRIFNAKTDPTFHKNI